MRLKKEELQKLIDDYHTELRLLTYRSKQVSDTIKDLEKQERAAKPKKKAGRPAKKTAKKAGRKATKKAAKKATKKAAKRGRPAKKTAKKATKKATKRGRPAKKAAAKKSTGGGYRLNVWDEVVMQTLGSKNVGVFADFLKAAKARREGKGMSDTALYARINQSLHKLANKRGVLKKVKHEGRGFGYSLS